MGTDFMLVFLNCTLIEHFTMVKHFLIVLCLCVSFVLNQDDWSPDPCFPMCTTGDDQTSPPPEEGCMKTDCFDEPLCVNLCGTMGCHSHLWGDLVRSRRLWNVLLL